MLVNYNTGQKPWASLRLTDNLLISITFSLWASIPLFLKGRLRLSALLRFFTTVTF